MAISIFLDSASISSIEFWLGRGIEGVTLNTSIARRSEITSYRDLVLALAPYAKEFSVSIAPPRVDRTLIIEQACSLTELAPSVFVKIPILDHHGHGFADVIQQLAAMGVRINITAVTDAAQLERSLICGLEEIGSPYFVSVFAGRLADNGCDPESVIGEIKSRCGESARLLWASARNSFAVTQAIRSGCSAITLSESILERLHTPADAASMSLSAVQMFERDAISANYRLEA